MLKISKEIVEDSSPEIVFNLQGRVWEEWVKKKELAVNDHFNKIIKTSTK